MINKKGQGMSISTIILLILGLIVLVVLIMGFVMGWDKVASLLGGNNLGSLKNSCTMACTTASSYDFCSVPRTVKDGKNDKFEATCQDLATKQTYISRNYGITACPNLCN